LLDALGGLGELHDSFLPKQARSEGEGDGLQRRRVCRELLKIDTCSADNKGFIWRDDTSLCKRTKIVRVLEQHSM
jgi:hypothetical protein